MRTAVLVVCAMGVLALVALELRKSPPAPAQPHQQTVLDEPGLPGIAPRRAPPTVVGTVPPPSGPLPHPATVEEAEKASPAFRAFMAPAHDKHPEVIDHWNFELGFLDFLRQCVAGRVHSRGSLRQSFVWQKLGDGKLEELTAIQYDADTPDNEDAMGGAVHMPLTGEEVQLVQSCSDHWSLVGSRREADPEAKARHYQNTARTFPLEEDRLYQIVRDGHF